MSLHNSYRLNVIYQAMLTATLGMSTLTAHAINLSQADILSAQHEPLSATINVSDIDAKNFNANLAPSNVYKQMGLTADPNIQIKFTPTSETTGRIELSSNTPISQPFADVVLSIDNNGEQHIEPQTLLMPASSVPSAIPADLTSPVMVASESEQNLPIVSDNAVLAGNPLAVEDVSPPPLFDNQIVQQASNYDNLDNSLDSNPYAYQPNSELTNNDQLANNAQPLATDTEKSVISSITPEGTNTQLEVLTATIVRKIYPAGTAPTADDSFNEANKSFNEQAQTTDESFTNPNDNEPSITTQSPSDTQNPSGATYVVQSGDNLWSIANEIAKANNIDVADVMKALFNENPNAFNNRSANQLKADAKLSIPNYTVVPSQKAISEAIASSQNRSKNSDLQAKSSAKITKNTRGQNTKAQSRKSTARPLPNPQVTLVTPSQSGQATGTSNNNIGSGNGDGLVASLKNTRSKTAGKARRVNSLNQELSSATQKLQLQNQKLAELEARLKSLKDKR